MSFNWWKLKKQYPFVFWVIVKVILSFRYIWPRYCNNVCKARFFYSSACSDHNVLVERNLYTELRSWYVGKKWRNTLKKNSQRSKSN